VVVVLEDSWESDTQIISYESFDYIKSEISHFAKKMTEEFLEMFRKYSERVYEIRWNHCDCVRKSKLTVEGDSSQ
jgi:hypothetical protein